MFKKISIIVFLFLLVLACDEADKRIKPHNLIPVDQMSEILHELYIVNSAKGVNRKLLELKGFKPEKYVLSKYNIDSTQFAESSAYYAFDTEVYKSIVDQVKSRLEKEKIEYRELMENRKLAAKKMSDSVNKIKRRRKDSTKKASKTKTKDSIEKKGINADSLFSNL
jgi:hypothetical protein